MGIIEPSLDETPRNALAGAARTRPTEREEGGPPPLAGPCVCTREARTDPYPSPAFFGWSGHPGGNDVYLIVVAFRYIGPCTLAVLLGCLVMGFVLDNTPFYRLPYHSW